MTSAPTASALTPEQEKHLREVIVKANPEIGGRFCPVCGKLNEPRPGYCNDCRAFLDLPPSYRSIRLADVLLACIEVIDKDHHPDNPSVRDQLYAQWTLFVCGKWDFRRDSLDDQTDACKRFLYDLLCTP